MAGDWGSVETSVVGLASMRKADRRGPISEMVGTAPALSVPRSVAQCGLGLPA